MRRVLWGEASLIHGAWEILVLNQNHERDYRGISPFIIIIETANGYRIDSVYIESI